jgi:hypothetical protein
MLRDILEVLPPEIWVQCIAEACTGDDYMTNLLTIMTVSRRWCQLLTQTPSLWTIIHVRYADKKSTGTISTFLYLSGSAQFSLTVWLPLSRGWRWVHHLFLNHTNRVKDFVLRADDPTFRSTVSDTEIQRSLQDIFETTHFSDSVRYMDIIADHPIEIVSTSIPRNLTSLGNWLIPLWILNSPSPIIPNLCHMSISITHVPNLLPRLSTFKHLQNLHIYSNKQEYSRPTPHPTQSMGPLNLSLRRFLFHGRFNWAPQQLLTSTSSTLEELVLQIRFLDLKVAVNTLETFHSLRRFKLVLLSVELENNPFLYSLVSHMSIPKWGLEKVEEFCCEMKTLEGSPIVHNLDTSHLWKLFRHIFPNVRILVWSPASKFRDSSQQESSFSDGELPSTHPILSAVNSLNIDRVEFLSGIEFSGLLDLSISSLSTFRWPIGSTFMQLHSLDMKVAAEANISPKLDAENFPVLKELIITFIGPRTNLQFFNLPSLVKLTILARSPTFSQGMYFCASLACQPWCCRLLEQINIQTFIEWDILYLLLKMRNFLNDPSVSRIKRIGLPIIPSNFHFLFSSLLAGQDPTVGKSEAVALGLSIQEAQNRLLNERMLVIHLRFI